MKAFVNSVHRFIAQKRYANHVYGKVFSLSNKIRSVEDVGELRDVIESLASDNCYEVPLLWYKLKDELKKTKKEWLLWPEVQAVGKKVGIQNDRMLEAGLQFFHAIGDVYFDPRSTKDFVVTNTQWLINRFRDVISVPSFREQQTFMDSRWHWSNLDKHGILHETVLENIWPQDAVEALVAIMKRFALLFPVPASYKLSYVRQVQNEATLYVVPSLLAAKKTTSESQESMAPPIMLMPRNRFLPIGMTSRLIASLINEDGWNVSGPVYKDSATFCPQGVASKVTVSLTQKSGMIEVTGNQLEPNTGHLLRQALHTIATKLCRLNSPVPFIAGIYCSGCHKLMEVELLGSLKSYRICPHHSGQNDPSKYSIWFTRSEGASKVHYELNSII